MALKPFISVIVFAVMTLGLGGCGSVSHRWANWFGESPQSQKPDQFYYVATAGLLVHDQPSSSSKSLGRFSLHEKVTRSRLQGGYAYVASQTRALEGWVDNAQLDWHLPRSVGPTSHEKPAAATPRDTASPAPSAEPVTPVATEQSAAPASLPAAPLATNSEPRSVAPAPTTSPAVTQDVGAKPKPEMFDPF